LTTPPPRRVFISAASGEFRPLRERLAALLQRSGINVEYQEIFPQTTSDTVRKLGGLIKGWALIVHIVGHNPGSTAHPDSVADLLADVPADQFLGRIPELRQRLGDLSSITYTQWEAFLALHYGVPMLLFAPSDACDSSTQNPMPASPRRCIWSGCSSPENTPTTVTTKLSLSGGSSPTSSRRDTGHQHPHLIAAVSNYAGLLHGNGCHDGDGDGEDSRDGRAAWSALEYEVSPNEPCLHHRFSVGGDMPRRPTGREALGFAFRRRTVCGATGLTPLLQDRSSSPRPTNLAASDRAKKAPTCRNRRFTNPLGRMLFFAPVLLLQPNPARAFRNLVS
jgi:hypothetical protein